MSLASSARHAVTPAQRSRMYVRVDHGTECRITSSQERPQATTTTRIHSSGVSTTSLGHSVEFYCDGPLPANVAPDLQAVWRDQIDPLGHVGSEGRQAVTSALGAEQQALSQLSRMRDLVAREGATLDEARISAKWTAAWAVDDTGVRTFSRLRSTAAVRSVFVADGARRSCLRYATGTNLDSDELELLATRAAGDVRAIAGNTAVRPGRHPVLLAPYAVAEFVELLSNLLSGDDPTLSDAGGRAKRERDLAGARVTVIDDASDAHLPYPHLFDREGTPGQRTTLLNDGAISTYLHTIRTADAVGVPPTGNALGSDLLRAPVTGPSNMYIAPADTKQDAALQQLGNGYWVREVHGAHSAFDPNTGDFAVGALGMAISQGSEPHPLGYFTVAGNLFQLLRDVVAIGEDLEFPRAAPFGGPSLLVEHLSIARF